MLLGELHVVLDADICHFAETRMSEDIFHAELANGDEIIIEGVKTINRMCRLISILAGCIVLASVIAVGAAMIASRLLAVPPPSAAPYNDSGLVNGNETTMNATGALPSNEYLNSNEAGNTLSSFVGTDSGKVILQMLNRTDTNFTHFGISSDAAILEGTDLMLITKMITPLWNGHAVSVNCNFAMMDSNRVDHQIFSSLYSSFYLSLMHWKVSMLRDRVWSWPTCVTVWC